MKEVKPRWSESLVLVCKHSRPDGALKASCGHHGAEELRAWLKKELRERGRWGAIRVATASCLDICPAQGVALSFQGRCGDGSTRVVDAHSDRQAILDEILNQAPPNGPSVDS